MTRTIASLVALGLVACHEPYSNEDLRFLYDSVPRDLEIEVPTEDGTTGVGTPGGPAPEGAARFYRDARSSADAINRDVLSTLAWIDGIVAEPPSRRRDDQRVWGPFPGENGVLYTLVADRVRTSTVFRATTTSTPAATDTLFEYALFGQTSAAPDPRLVLSGRQATDPGDPGIQGALFLDLDAARALDPASTGEGQVFVTYDTRFTQLTIELALGDLYIGADPAAAWRHTQGARGEGSFLFFVREDVDPTTSALETWVVAARWLPDGAGRADVLLNGGDLTLPLFASECWNQNFMRTYILSNIPDPDYFAEGRLEACAPELRTAQFPE